MKLRRDVWMDNLRIPVARGLAVVLLLACAPLLPVILAGCAQKQAARDWQAILNPIQEKFAADSRLSVFRVEVRVEGERIVAAGEVEDSAAKAEILVRLTEATGKPVSDEIRVLPDPALSPKDIGIVNVSVGNVRRDPEHPAELVTQVLLGESVNLLQKKGGWLYIHCSDRYLGWIDDGALLQVDSKAGKEWNSADRLIVLRQYDLLRSAPAASAAVVCDLVMGNLLRRAGERGAWVEVSLPDGRHGFIERAAVTGYAGWRTSRALTPESIEATARDFMGVPYLWGGTSAKGFDCSGFVKTVFALNGTQLSRDADQQARQGEDREPGADFAYLRRGDLLFFGRKATAGKGESIVHVGIYLADRRFIHCSGRVRISSMDPSAPDYDAWHVNGFIRARRFVVSP